MFSAIHSSVSAHTAWQLEIIGNFVAITGGDSFEFKKPDGRHLRETANLAGMPLDSAVMIGDSAADINAAKNAGIPSIAVTFGYSDQPVSELGASKVINHYNEFDAAFAALSVQT